MFARLLHHAFAAPVDAGEQARFVARQADQRVTAVFCRNEYAVIAVAQGRSRLMQVFHGQRRAISADADDFGRVSKRLLEGMCHAGAEIVALLRMKRRAVGL